MEPDGRGLVAGRAEPGAAVEVLADEQVVAQAEADEDGNFVAFLSLAPSALPRALSLRDGTGRPSEETVILAPSTAPPPPEPSPADASPSLARTAPMRPRPPPRPSGTPGPRPSPTLDPPGATTPLSARSQPRRQTQAPPSPRSMPAAAPQPNPERNRP
jgi:hypothetical protein